ncbi:Putative membrane-bound redox modulator Alx [Methylobacterium cerastii]|uniref:Membrane-bound redox modulator Alx n=1 Tax=Methylobacterium cerastii TaxID=932741 RepID=A0ABQ4QDD9_9HYPH|nr:MULTISPECIES: TerC family protein [Methylobacterium]TXM96130.1 TerC family protein [Methylobacterium sp. WL122]TXM98691.1 TerC family protein [Methylobacterium sp. WL103]GJD43230.1 Putative membrane-bound redox modulator Alx [Methylobacterium cerastii]
MVDFLYVEWLGKPIWMWLGFHALVAALLAFDLGLLHRDKEHEIGVKESLLLTAFYFSLGLAFGGWIWWYLGAQPAQEYVTGLVVEKSLSMDNVFVIAVILSALGIPLAAQHRVLVWGILAAVLLRGLMIGLGAALVHQAAWVLSLFAAFLIYAGLKMLFSKEEDAGDLQDHAAVRWLRAKLRITPELHGQHFMVRKADPRTGKTALWLTPLALALVLVNGADVIFAVDSVPAIFAITTDTFVVYTSNIFAILGLRALYFALAAMVDRFAYLKTALAFILIFIGTKIVVADTFGLVHVPPWVSLAVTVVLLTVGILYSLWRTRGEVHADTATDGREAELHGRA